MGRICYVEGLVVERGQDRGVLGRGKKGDKAERCKIALKIEWF